MSLDGNPLTLALFLGALSLIPLMFITTTAFLKIAMVLMIVRNALGVQQVPPSMAVYSIALAATFFVMAPVFSEIKGSLQGVDSGVLDEDRMMETLDRVKAPLMGFMASNVDSQISERLKSTAREMWPARMSQSMTNESIFILLPSFVISELQAGFKIGFLIYIPFVVIDLIVSNILLALGMQMVAPITVTVPIKILLFVLVDGWAKLLESLIYTYL